ncbi:MAG: hypothetical protein J2P44_03530 [Candidatus Dormibacteraeota bacterium]|nr:hypothetical protein [Candidatus Dormibacteraeota bacterium]
MAAPQLLEETYRLCLQIGDTNPGRVQEQLLELAERPGLSLDAWVGRWQHALAQRSPRSCASRSSSRTESTISVPADHGPSPAPGAFWASQSSASARA